MCIAFSCHVFLSSLKYETFIQLFFCCFGLHIFEKYRPDYFVICFLWFDSGNTVLAGIPQNDVLSSVHHNKNHVPQYWWSLGKASVFPVICGEVFWFCVNNLINFYPPVLKSINDSCLGYFSVAWFFKLQCFFKKITGKAELSHSYIFAYINIDSLILYSVIIHFHHHLSWFKITVPD